VGLKNQKYINIYIQEKGGLDESSPYKKLHDKKAGLMNQAPTI